jgi:hypothetical protein
VYGDGHAVRRKEETEVLLKKKKKKRNKKQKKPQKEPEKRRLSSLKKIIQIIDLSVLASYYDEKGSTVLYCTFKTIGWELL